MYITRHGREMQNLYVPSKLILSAKAGFVLYNFHQLDVQRL